MMLEAALMTTLLFTVPSTNQRHYMGVDPATGDSVLLFDCSGGPETHDVDSIRVYRWPILPGSIVTIGGSKSVRGLEGLEDSISVDAGAGAHFWITAVDTAGNESCVGNVVYVGPITAVGPIEAVFADPIVGVMMFDIAGRRAPPSRVASGIYFVLETHKSGKKTSRKVVVLR